MLPRWTSRTLLMAFRKALGFSVTARHFVFCVVLIAPSFLATANRRGGRRQRVGGEASNPLYRDLIVR